MNLTDKERAAMVREMKDKAKEYRESARAYVGVPKLYKHYSRMALNYEALAEALAERKPFEAVA